MVTTKLFVMFLLSIQHFNVDSDSKNITFSVLYHPEIINQYFVLLISSIMNESSQPHVKIL